MVDPCEEQTSVMARHTNCIVHSADEGVFDHKETASTPAIPPRVAFALDS